MEVIKRLKKISLFSKLKNSKKSLEKIAKIIKVERFPAGKNIIIEDEMGDKMYILNQGTVRIEKKTLANDKFTVVNLSEEMNIFFGEQALMDNDKRSATVVAVTKVECYTLKQKEFEALCESDYKIGYYITKEIAKILSTRLRKATKDNITLIDALVSSDDNGF